MGSSISSGYYQDQAAKIEKTECKKSPNKKHKWKTEGSWPSICRVCKHCKVRTYSK